MFCLSSPRASLPDAPNSPTIAWISLASVLASRNACSACSKPSEKMLLFSLGILRITSFSVSATGVIPNSSLRTSNDVELNLRARSNVLSTLPLLKRSSAFCSVFAVCLKNASMNLWPFRMRSNTPIMELYTFFGTFTRYSHVSVSAAFKMRLNISTKLVASRSKSVEYPLLSVPLEAALSGFGALSRLESSMVL